MNNEGGFLNSTKMEWDDLTYFGKGVASGIVLWILLIILAGVRSDYINVILKSMNPDIFYVFDLSVGFFGMIFLGVFLIVCFGTIGWLYGRIVEEKV